MLNLLFSSNGNLSSWDICVLPEGIVNSPPEEVVVSPAVPPVCAIEDIGLIGLELNGEVVGAGAGNANIDVGVTDELKRDGDEICPGTEKDDAEGIKILGEINGVNEDPKAVGVKAGICGANLLVRVEVFKRLEEV